MRKNDTLSRILFAESHGLIRGRRKEIIPDNFEFTLTSEAYSENAMLNELGHSFFNVLIPDTELSDGNGLGVLKKSGSETRLFGF